MSGDVNIAEQLIIVDRLGLEAASLVQEGAPTTEPVKPGRVLHVYGNRVRIVEQEPGIQTLPQDHAPTPEFGALAEERSQKLKPSVLPRFECAHLRSTYMQNRIGPVRAAIGIYHPEAALR